MDRRKLRSKCLVWYGRTSERENDPGQILRVGLFKGDFLPTRTDLQQQRWLLFRRLH